MHQEEKFNCTPKMDVTGYHIKPNHQVLLCAYVNVSVYLCSSMENFSTLFFTARRSRFQILI